MSRAFVLVASSVLLGIVACQSDQQMLASGSKAAIDSAVRRGRFELSCPAATGTVLSSTMLQPVLWNGIEREEYTIGVSGCEKKMTYVVICPQGTDSCVAGRGDR